MNLPTLFMLISLSLLLLPGTASPSAQASVEATAPVTTHPAKPVHRPITQVLFKPSGPGKPPTTRGAGSRDDRRCPQDSTTQPLALTALVPSNQTGLTWAARPTVWVYLPKTSARQMVLSVKAEDSQPLFQRFLPITGEAGIVGIPFAENAPPLAVGKSYQWAVVLVCGDRPSPNDPFVTAWVQRVAAAQPLNRQQSALERAAHYAEQGAWYDALTALAETRRSQSTDAAVTKLWANFLAQPDVGLEPIANVPVR